MSHYEGLVHATAARIEHVINRYDGEEIRQVFRLKVWQALRAWDPKDPRIVKRVRKGEFSLEELRDRYVYGCVVNQKIDLLKRDKERERLIIDAAAAAAPLADEEAQLDRFEFDQQGGQWGAEFEAVLNSAPLVPNTLNHNERLVLACMYLGYNGPQTAERLGVDRSQVASLVRSLREKMRDWRPDGAAAAPEPEPGDRSPAPALEG